MVQWASEIRVSDSTLFPLSLSNFCSFVGTLRDWSNSGFDFAPSFSDCAVGNVWTSTSFEEDILGQKFGRIGIDWTMVSEWDGLLETILSELIRWIGHVSGYKVGTAGEENLANGWQTTFIHNVERLNRSPSDYHHSPSTSSSPISFFALRIDLHKIIA